MSARTVRRIVLAVCVGGIAGMIVMSIRDSSGGAMAFGIVTSAAIVCTIVATAVANGMGGGGGVRAAAGVDAEALGARLEAGVGELVAAGADESRVRSLVAEAIRYGRTSG